MFVFELSLERGSLRTQLSLFSLQADLVLENGIEGLNSQPLAASEIESLRNFKMILKNKIIFYIVGFFLSFIFSNIVLACPNGCSLGEAKLLVNKSKDIKVNSIEDGITFSVWLDDLGVTHKIYIVKMLTNTNLPAEKNSIVIFERKIRRNKNEVIKINVIDNSYKGGELELIDIQQPDCSAVHIMMLRKNNRDFYLIKAHRFHPPFSDDGVYSQAEPDRQVIEYYKLTKEESFEGGRRSYPLIFQKVRETVSTAAVCSKFEVESLLNFFEK